MTGVRIGAGGPELSFETLNGDVVVGDDHAAVAFVEGGQVGERADEWRQRLPAQDEWRITPRLTLSAGLRVEAGLDGVRADVGAGLRDVILRANRGGSRRRRCRRMCRKRR